MSYKDTSSIEFEKIFQALPSVLFVGGKTVCTIRVKICRKAVDNRRNICYTL